MKTVNYIGATLAVVLSLGVSGVYAQQMSSTMIFSGTSENSANNLQVPNTSNDEDVFTGSGSLGSFTVRNIRAISNVPGISAACSGANQLFLPELAGGGIFRFQDGSLLYVALTDGGDCIDLTTNIAHCKLDFQVTGGTGRFTSAMGALTMTETVQTALSDALGNPIFFGATGEYTGTVSGVAIGTGEPPAQ